MCLHGYIVNGMLNTCTMRSPGASSGVSEGTYVVCGGEFIDIKKVIELHACISQVRVGTRLGGKYAIFRSGIRIYEECNRIVVGDIVTEKLRVSGTSVILFSYRSMCGNAPHAQIWGIYVNNKQAWARMHNEKVLHGDAKGFTALLKVRQKPREPYRAAKTVLGSGTG